MRRLLAASLLVTLVLPRAAQACLWDYDTLLEERRGLPAVADAIFGRYEVHSKEYYEDRLRRLGPRGENATLTADEYDDLGVAYDRLGQSLRAADLMAAKEKLFPGLYTTAANRGTFLVHGGKLEEGLVHLQKALEINPQAHFGRERYQVRAIEWVLAAKKDAKLAETHTLLGPSVATTLRLDLAPLDEKAYSPRFARVRLKDLATVYPPAGEDPWSAIVGMLVLGGDPGNGWHEFYFALGELIAVSQPYHAGTPKEAPDLTFLGREVFASEELAWAAFERARERGSPRTAQIDAYQKALLGPERRARVAEEYREKRAEAARWVADYQKLERELVAAGKDPHDESLWASFYAQHERVQRLGVYRPLAVWEVRYWTGSPTRLVLTVAGLAIAAVIALKVKLDRQRRNAPA